MESPKPPEAGSSSSTSKGLFVVGIGASAGGLEAIQTLFDATNDRMGAAFVVVQHLSPDFKSMMGELLSKHTRMPIHTVTDSAQLEPNQIYLIPPKRNLIIRDGRLIAEEYPREQVLNLPINVFFRSLAENYGERAVAIVLSGTGSDGAVGVRSVREMGGVVMVQDEASARFDGMPHSAMATGMVDFVLAPQDMPTEIARYIQYKNGDGQLSPETAAKPDNDRLGQILALVRQETRIDFTQYKVNTILRRVERRIGLTQSNDIEGYIELLRTSPGEIRTLGQELLISVTNFFRDNDAFDVLADEFVPELVEKAHEAGELRAWVAGCATGEEAYSLAMLIHEELERRDLALPFKVFATDIDRRAVERAATGVYHAGFMSNVGDERIRKFFVQRSDNYQVIPAIREKVIFAVHDLVKDPPFTRIDFVSCRNLLIYFQPMLQQRALSRMLFALRPEGILFLGPSETTGDLSHEFDTANSRWKILRKRADARVITPGELHQQMRTNPQRIWSPMPNTTVDWSSTAANAPRPEEIVQSALHDYVPAGVALNESLQLLHIFGAVERYFRFPSGPPNFDVVRLARGDLSIPLATAVHKAMKEEEDVVYNDVSFRDDGGETRLTLRVRFCRDSRSERPYLLVFFEPKDHQVVETETSGSTPSVDLQAKQRIGDLEQELQYTRESLQATIEELETSNEELQSSNEELMAANEELQSTNEELNSVNEELYTVNAEYQKKIDELIELNADMDQLLSSTSVAVLFLDRELTVRRFTDTATTFYHVLERDVGRPIQHLSRRFECDDLLHKIEHVRTTRAAYEEEIVNDEGRNFLMTVRPHGAITERLNGIVVTFIEVTHLRQAQAQIAAETQRYELAMDAVAAGAVEWLHGSDELSYAGRFADVLGIDQATLPATRQELEAWFLAHVVDDERERVASNRDSWFGSDAGTHLTSGGRLSDTWTLARGDDGPYRIEIACRAITEGQDIRVALAVRSLDGPRA